MRTNQFGLSVRARQQRRIKLKRYVTEIRNYIRSLYDNETADAVRIQYGGSVKSENALEILGEPNIDGALVGGASLVVDEFIDLLKLQIK